MGQKCLFRVEKQGATMPRQVGYFLKILIHWVFLFGVLRNYLMLMGIAGISSMCTSITFVQVRPGTSKRFPAERRDKNV